MDPDLDDLPTTDDANLVLIDEVPTEPTDARPPAGEGE